MDSLYDNIWASRMEVLHFQLAPFTYDERNIAGIGYERLTYPGDVAASREATGARAGEIWATGFATSVTWAFDGPDARITSAVVFSSPNSSAQRSWELVS